MINPPYRLAMSLFHMSICLFLSLGITTCSFTPNRQQPSLTYIKDEFDRIGPPADAALARPTNSSEKGSQGIVVASYLSTLSSAEIKTHYQTQLVGKGWKFCRSEKVIYSGRDYEGEHVFYLKDVYIADLQLAGTQASEFKWTYTFSISWGLFDETGCR